MKALSILPSTSPNMAGKSCVLVLRLEVVGDVFLHCCYVGIASAPSHCPKTGKGQFIEPASSGQLDHWGRSVPGKARPAVGQPQPTEASAPSQFRPPPFPLFTSRAGFGGWSDRTHKSTEWYKDQNVSSLHIECSQLPPNSSSLNICGLRVKNNITGNMHGNKRKKWPIILPVRDGFSNLMPFLFISLSLTST